MTNPLLQVDGSPEFHSIASAHIEPAIDILLADCHAALEEAAGPAVPAEFDAIASVLDTCVERLGAAWGVVSHLHGVADTPELRVAHKQALPKVTAFFTALSGEPRLYRKYKTIAAGARLPAPRARAVANTVRDAVLSGAELDGTTKERFSAIQQRTAELSQRFATHVLDATDRYAYWVSEEELSGVPADVVASARAAAEAEGRAGFKIGLQFSTYSAVLRHAQNRALRATLYRAYFTRASEQGSADLDNTPVMRELIALRQERACLLGYANHAQVSLVSKMAGTPARVTGFLMSLTVRARAQAQREAEALKQFARTELGIAELEAWDVSYASEQLRQKDYAFSQQDVKQYFTVDRVLEGLFKLVNTLFGIDIVEHHAPVWHDSVRVYRILRDGVVLGQFYLDLYSRPGKRGGAWVNGAQSRWRRPGGSVRTAQSYVVCNFAPPDANGIARLGHEDLVTLFHEFGHNLHFLLSTIEDLGVSGFGGVEWDAVELPSQLMENFCWQWDVLEPLSGHAATGAPLPRALFDKMLAAKNFQGGLQILRQVEFALFDMRLHAEPGSEADICRLVDEVRASVAVLPVPAFNRFSHSFSHIFSGGYAAGYYSYLWAEVLSSDAWSAFEDAGVLEPAAWDRYRESILEVGGSRPMSQSFEAFRGRPPTVDALLRHRGLAGPATATA